MELKAMASGARQNKTKTLRRPQAKGKNTTLDNIKSNRNSIAKILTNLKKKKTTKANSFGEGKPSKESLETKLELKHEGSTSTTTTTIDKKDDPFYYGGTSKQIFELTFAFLEKSHSKGVEKFKLTGPDHFCNCGDTSSGSYSEGSYSEEHFWENSDVEQDDARSKP